MLNVPPCPVKNRAGFYRKNGLKKFVMYVVRVDNDEKFNTSKPCKNCIKALKAYGIKKVYYFNSAKEFVCEKINTIKSDHISVGWRHMNI